MTKNALIILYVLLFCACNRAGKKEDSHNGPSAVIIANEVQSIPIHIDGNDCFNHIEEYLHTTSYVKLASEPLLADIKEIHIHDNHIYVWDQTGQIVCYDMQGKVLYRIHAIGNGPGEYSKIHAFAINPDKEEIVIYDNLKASLLYYSMLNGKY